MPDQTKNTIKPMKPLLKKLILTVVVLIGVLGAVLYYNRPDSSDDKYHVFRLIQAKYKKGVVRVDFEVNYDNLKQSVTAYVKQNHEGDNFTPKSFLIEADITRPGRSPGVTTGVTIRLPLAVHGRVTNSFPLLFPMFDYLYVNRQSSLAYSVRIEARAEGIFRIVKTNSLVSGDFQVPICHRDQSLRMWAADLAGAFSESDVRMELKHGQVRAGATVTLDLGDNGKLKIPADAFPFDSNWEFQTLFASEVLDYWLDLSPQSTNRDFVAELDIPYAGLGAPKNIRLIVDSLYGKETPQKVPSAWMDTSTKIIKVPMRSHLTVLTGVRD